MGIVASDGWLGSQEYSSLLYNAAWVGSCVGGVFGCVFYFEMKSTAQCRRSTSELLVL